MRRILALVMIAMVGMVFSFYINYQVQSGDTIYSISKGFGIPIPVLLDWNPDVSISNLKIGQKLKIPFVPGIMYKPVKTIALSTLSKLFFVDPEEILAVNPSIGSTISAGKEVFVPVGKVNTSFTQLADFIWPVYGSISSEFGWRIHPIYNKNMFHTGIDIKADTGTPVFASRSGKVKYAGWKSGYGNLIIIDHGNGIETYYAHLSKINVYVGLYVEKGDFIARVGSTGTSTGPHLHFEVRKNDQTNDPVAYLPRTNTYVMRRVLSE
ncbi:MAG: M23 family metallopeptidase [Fervidobacterium sp.]|uniref:LysM peptidoglycan-binding domain-containing M23 family metallopeptidase n=1 Tax=Fervidobacterium TaxID=2422 RepID=UPI002209058E|nr:peptidase M23 [Fervidobacterium riparium]